jgi:hypothetical protein
MQGKRAGVLVQMGNGVKWRESLVHKVLQQIRRFDAQPQRAVRLLLGSLLTHILIGSRGLVGDNLADTLVERSGRTLV